MSVYFIRVGRYLKIGFSENPERRCKNLWRSSTRYSRPWDLAMHEPRELLLAVEGDKDHEHRSHIALADFAVGCEWFIDEPEVRDFMTRVGDYCRVDLHPFPRVPRPGGPFEPVSHEHMLPERVAELDSLIRRSRARHAARVTA